MRHNRPASRKVVDDVGHDRMSVSAADPIRDVISHTVFGGVVAAIAVLLFEAPLRQLVAAARPDIVASVEPHGDRTQAVDRVRLVRETGPAGLSTKVILRPGIRAKRSQHEYEDRPGREEPHHPGYPG